MAYGTTTTRIEHIPGLRFGVIIRYTLKNSLNDTAELFLIERLTKNIDTSHKGKIQGSMSLRYRSWAAMNHLLEAPGLIISVCFSEWGLQIH